MVWVDRTSLASSFMRYLLRPTKLLSLSCDLCEVRAMAEESVEPWDYNTACQNQMAAFQLMRLAVGCPKRKRPWSRAWILLQPDMWRHVVSHSKEIIENLILQLINSMDLSCVLEADSFSFSQEILASYGTTVSITVFTKDWNFSLFWTRWIQFTPPPPVILLLRFILTLILLTWRKGWVPNTASNWQMGFNSVFKGFISYNLRRFFKVVCFMQVFPPNPVCISFLYCVPHFPLCHPPHLVALIICGEQNKPWSFSSYEFLHSPDFPEQLSHAVHRSKLVVKRC